MVATLLALQAAVLAVTAAWLGLSVPALLSVVVLVVGSRGSRLATA